MRNAISLFVEPIGAMELRGAIAVAQPNYTAASVDVPYGLWVDASRSSTIYGNDSTVQPASRQALMIIRAWRLGGCTVVTLSL